ncbi:MAG: hypothetical protein QF441_02575 [Bacteriovoracaceae bacterium]|nr:hypothetical protein [Halobacteriovoraceae bacterium]MDP7319459.1 hypothetical protein [Bacteriovoracaceae bacterium]
MIKQSIILFFFTFPLLLMAANKGDLSFQSLYYPIDNDKKDYEEILQIYLEQDYESTTWWAKLSLNAGLNRTYKENSYLFINDGYIAKTFNSSFVNIKLGYQIFNWSKLESYNPTDVINARIFSAEVENLEKKGELSFSFSKEFSDSTLSFYLFPFFENNFYPSDNSRLSLAKVAQESFWVAKDKEPQNQKEKIQFGLSYDFLYGQGEYFLFGLKHINRRQPLFGFHKFSEVGTNLIPNGDFSAYYFEVIDIGFSGAISGENKVFKFELLYTDFLDEESPIFNGERLVTKNDYGHVSIGYEYTYQYDNGLSSDFFVEYHRVSGVSQQEAWEINIFQNDLFFGKRLRFNDQWAREIYFGHFLDLERKQEGIGSLKYEQRLSNFWRASVAYRWVIYDQQDSKGLALLEDNDSLHFELKRFF